MQRISYKGEAPNLAIRLLFRVEENARKTRLPSGRTLAQVAQQAGLPLNTVRWRHDHGWPEDMLSLPADRATIRGPDAQRGRRPRRAPGRTLDV